ncbi:putative glucan endo-1,3-beta-D-glucosidase [Rosa chinensis]|uniref:glucan endo-1,3-beta-D-glucosidase n=1 Tax=Rosa chinensis TaxID=74649 RepID=A0A2P6PRQ9_ROSCH|nr:putative glucan endo-1,3-beta-D-glucosidase [Rosa chinensis]
MEYVVNLYKKYGIGKMRLFDPSLAALQALRGSQIRVILGIQNEDLSNLAELFWGLHIPPSSGAFIADTRDVMSGILAFLSRQGSPLLINAYPYFAYVSDPVNVRLDYAQFTATSPRAVDGNLNFFNLLTPWLMPFSQLCRK